MLNRTSSIFIWLAIISAILYLIPQVANIKFSNLDYRREKGESRTDINTTTSPWQAVGRLRLPQGVCTATLITDRIILSARHCFVDGKKIIPAQTIHFELERNGEFIASTPLKTIRIPSTSSIFDFSESNIKNDYGFALLESPVDLNAVGITPPLIADTSPPDNTTLAQAGYGENRKKLRGDNNCAIIKKNKHHIIQHNCLITFGDSGGPIFYQNNDGVWYLSGVNSYLESLMLVEHAFAIGPENYYQELKDFIKNPKP